MRSAEQKRRRGGLSSPDLLHPRPSKMTKTNMDFFSFLPTLVQTCLSLQLKVCGGSSSWRHPGLHPVI